MQTKKEIADCLRKLDEIEEGFTNSPHALTLEMLFQTGVLTDCDTVQAGDFNLVTWSHSSDGSFSVGALERVRYENQAFPRHEHDQRLWLLCSKGAAQLTMETDQKIDLKIGEYTVVEPNIKHLIEAKTEECVLLIVTLPADPGMNRGRIGQE